MIFREEATSALAGFHAVPLSWSNWKLEMLGFVEGGKPEYLFKNPSSRMRTSNKLDPHMAPGQNLNLGHMGGRQVFFCALLKSD